MLAVSNLSTKTSNEISIIDSPITHKNNNNIDLRLIINAGELIHASHAPVHDWSQVVQAALSGEVQRYTRHPRLRSFYISVFYPQVQKQYGSMGALLRKRFGWSLQSTTTLKKEGEMNYFTKDIESDQFRITRNDWPYAFTKDINHYIVWSLLPFASSEYMDIQGETFAKKGIIGVSGKQIDNDDNHQDCDVLKQQLRSFVRLKWPEEYYDTVFFVNPTWKQTVPEISHMHVLVRPKSTTVGDGSHALTKEYPY